MELLEARNLLAQLLPDLTVWTSQSQGFLYGWTVQGNDLRFTTAAANIGAGRLELRGSTVNPDGTQTVLQRIYDSTGPATDVAAGNFTYHPGHQHIHWDGFAETRLRAVGPNGEVGAIVAAGDKVSYCLLDVARYNTSGPASPQFVVCESTVQGLSVGWADIYDQGLPGQSIDITGVPDGTYWLETVLDPDSQIRESNESNNAARIQINLVRGPGGGGIQPDTFEPNNSFAAASILAPPEDHTYSGNSIHASGNDDYYRVTASGSGALTFQTTFQHSQGDIDIEVFSPTQALLGISDSVGNSETFTIQNAVQGQFYYIRVFGFQGATNPNYSLFVDQPAGGGIPGDIFEDNDTFATARALTASDQTHPNLTINAPNDDDYYAITPTTSGTLTVSLAFTHSQGNINLQVLNGAQTVLGSSSSTSNAEQVSLQVTAGTTYYIRAFGLSGATNPTYSLTVDVPATTPPPAASEYYVSTTAGGTLTSTVPGSSSVSFTDSDILKLTVQSNGQYQYQLHFDGSDVGLSTANEDIDAFTFLADGSILISTVGAFSVPTTGGGTITGGGEDLLRFVPTSTGPTTAGQWSLYFDGSDVGLSGTAENIDAVAVLPNGHVLISTTGAVSVPGGVSRADEDLLEFTPTTLGATTVGSWAVYFDGSDVGLNTNDGEDINALYVRQTGALPTLYFSTVGAFSVTGLSGANEDAFAFNPTTLGAGTTGTFGPGLAFDGSVHGLGSYIVDGIHLGPLPTAGATASQSAAISSSAVGAATGANSLGSQQRISTAGLLAAPATGESSQSKAIQVAASADIPDAAPTEPAPRCGCTSSSAATAAVTSTAAAADKGRSASESILSNSLAADSFWSEPENVADLLAGVRRGWRRR